MDLESYRKEKKLTYRELRERLGWDCDESNVRRIARGLEWPKPDRLVAIIELDGGRVSLRAMMERYTQRPKHRTDTDLAASARGEMASREDGMTARKDA